MYTLIEAIAGSRLYGIHNDESDTDTMGIAIGTKEEKLGLRPITHEGKDDHVTYEFAQYCKLLLNGNPTIMQLVFTPKEYWIQWDERWPRIQHQLRQLITERCRASFLGYLDGQRQKLIRNKGQRQELIDKYGFDTKFAGHMVRLGIQGIEMMIQGEMILPMRPEHVLALRAIRNGERTQEYCMAYAANLEDRLKHEPSVLAPNISSEWVDKWIVSVYDQFWSRG